MSDEKKIPAETAAETAAPEELTEEQLGEVAGGIGQPTQGQHMDKIDLTKDRRDW